MLALATAMVSLLPKYWRRDGPGETLIDWLRLRQEELVEGEERGALLTDAQLRVLDEIDGLDDSTSEAQSGLKERKSRSEPVVLRSRLGWAAAVTIILGSCSLYLVLGSLDDVYIAQQLDTLGDADPNSIPILIEKIEARVEARPNNSDYLSLLGEYYTAQERHGDALRVYKRLLELFPEAPEVLARAAQADYLYRGRVLSDGAKRWAEAALAADPDQRTALGTLGMAAFESEDYAGALDHWQRLLRFEAPGSPGYAMMESVIVEARRRLADTSDQNVVLEAANKPSTAGIDVGVGVTVQLPEGAYLTSSEVIFVIARPADSTQRMPTAVVKRAAQDLPFSVRLTDSSAMAGQRISILEAVDIEVQVSPTGQPGRDQASWLGEAFKIKPSVDAEVVITLNALTPQRN